MLNLKDYISSKFNLELPEISIIQRTTNNPKIYTGPGSISQNASGELILKMYSNSADLGEYLFEKANQPGKIIEDSKYFDISAKDEYGFVWTSKKNKINKHFGQSGKSLIVFADLYQISNEIILRNSVNQTSVNLYLNKEISLPTAPFLEKKSSEKHTQLPYDYMRLIAEISIKEHQIRIFEQRDWIEINIISNLKEISDLIIQRSCESLQFITCSKLTWFYYE